MYILKTERVRTTYKTYCNVCKTGEFMEDSWGGGGKHSAACSLSFKKLYIKGTLWIFLTNEVLCTFSSSHQGVRTLCTLSLRATKTALSSSHSICSAIFFLIAEILHYLHPCAHGLIVFLFFYAALLLLAVHYHHRLLMGGICEVNCRMKHGTSRLQVRMSSRTTRYRENWSLIIKTFPHSTAGGQIFHRVINEEILKKWQLGSN